MVASYVVMLCININVYDNILLCKFAPSCIVTLCTHYNLHRVGDDQKGCQRKRYEHANQLLCFPDQTFVIQDKCVQNLFCLAINFLHFLCGTIKFNNTWLPIYSAE